MAGEDCYHGCIQIVFVNPCGDQEGFCRKPKWGSEIDGDLLFKNCSLDFGGFDDLQFEPQFGLAADFFRCFLNTLKLWCLLGVLRDL
jgi:hypothetical protein